MRCLRVLIAFPAGDEPLLVRSHEGSCQAFHSGLRAYFCIRWTLLVAEKDNPDQTERFTCRLYDSLNHRSEMSAAEQKAGVALDSKFELPVRENSVFQEKAAMHVASMCSATWNVS